MRRVIQRTVTTTTIVSLTITHSESAEAVEYTLVDSAEELNPGGGSPSPEQSPVTLTPADEEEKPSHEQPSTDV